MTAGALLLCLATPFVAALLILLNHKRPTLINTVNTVAPFISLLALIWLASLYNPAANFTGYRRQYRHHLFSGTFGIDICRLGLRTVASEFVIRNDLYV